jgi:membrane-associated phospholipid phosphatase
VGVHYPSDVLAGMLLALAGSCAVWHWKRHLLKN